MSKLFVLMWMLFDHVLDDYFLQGCLANLKQKSYWEKNAPDNLYKYDYIMALIMHSISWSFMIMLPIAAYFNFNVDWVLFLTFVLNAMIHMVIDDAKANRHQLNLIADQIIHILQILSFWLIFANV